MLPQDFVQGLPRLRRRADQGSDGALGVRRGSDGGEGRPPDDDVFGDLSGEVPAARSDYLHDYIWITVGVLGGAVETVEQVFERIAPAAKFEKLIEHIDNFYVTRNKTDRMLIFTNAKDTAKWLDEQLYDKKMDSGALHGNLTQEERKGISASSALEKSTS